MTALAALLMILLIAVLVVLIGTLHWGIEQQRRAFAWKQMYESTRDR